MICCNVLGSCYGSTGPSSIDPRTGRPYATRFPLVTVRDMVRAQFLLLVCACVCVLSAAPVGHDEHARGGSHEDNPGALVSC